MAEALQRVALGLSRNPSVLASELLLYLHATLHPFVLAVVREKERQKKARGMLRRSTGGTNDKNKSTSKTVLQQQQGGSRETDEEEGDDHHNSNNTGDDDDDDDEYELPSYLREESSDDEDMLYAKKPSAGGKRDRKDDVTGFKASTWLPTDRLRGLSDQHAALAQRDKERAERTKTFDGPSHAPKMTGRNRHLKSQGKKGSQGNGASTNVAGDSDAYTNPAAMAAVRFCLSLFSAALRRNRLDYNDPAVRAMAAPFVPLLGQCLRLSGATDVVTLAMRCLCTLLTWDLPTCEPTFVQAVAGRMLRLMWRGGALRSTENELVRYLHHVEITFMTSHDTYTL